MSVVLAAIMPVFLVAGAGYVARRALPIDVKTLAALNLYVFIPCLVFNGILQRPIEWSFFGQSALAAVLMVAGMTAILTTVAWARGLKGADKSALLMSLFPNLGNFGLPVVLFAFKEEGFAYAIVILVCGSLLQNTVGIYLAQRSNHGVTDAFKRVFRFPMIYAFACALLCQHLGWQPPAAIGRAVELTANAAIPVQLLILGAKLAETRLETGADVFIACAVRLVGGPLLAYLIALLVQFEGLPLKVFVLQMSSPVAVGMAVYGVQFGVKPGYLASLVSWTFLLSLVSVSVVLWLLMP
jgi:malate permease and related proteins